ncbi:MAG: restriction endonuclease subunit S [Phycisphaerales bacterium]|nr:restriction endonuclease subunit S [Phycisphaerales bacterium]
MTASVPIAKVARLNPPTPRELFDHPEREVSFVPMAQLGEDGRLRNGKARPVGELAQGYTYFANGDVIVAKITPCLQNGKAAYVENLKGGHGFGSTEFHVIRPGHALDGRYLFYMIWNPTFRHFGEQRFTGSAGQKRMPASAVAEFEIPLPYPDDPKRSVAEQKRIAAILDKADAIRRRRHETARLTDQLIPSLFYDMFGDPVLNPRGLPARELGDLLDFMTSGSRGWAAHYADSGRLFLRIQNVGRNRLLLDDVAYVRVEETAESRRTATQAGDVLLSVTADLGRTAVIPKELGPAHINQHLVLLRTQRMEPLYLSQYLASTAGQRQFAAKNRAAVKAGLNFDDVRSLRILEPPRREQQQFSRAYEAVMDQHAKQLRITSTADGLFDSLVQRAFRGEL